MLWMLLLLFAAALAAVPLQRLLGAAVGAVLSFVPLCVGGYLVWSFEAAPRPGLEERYKWLPELGVELTLRLDGLALLFAVLILGVGFAVLVYSAAYFQESSRQGSFFARMLVFTGSMLGLVLVDDVVSLYVFWEMTTLASFFLIGWHPEQSKVRQAALTAIIVTGAGGLALLLALVVLSVEAAGGLLPEAMALRISELNSVGMQAHPQYALVVVLVVVAAIAKSAQAPLWFWLPAAMQAPTPVSAYLHSATMVKAGVFLLARLTPALGGTQLWSWSLISVGGFTMVVAGVGALGQSDLKRLLAFSTVSILGALVFLLGIGSRAALASAMLLVVAHALYKAALFLIVGSVEKATGTRELDRLGGLAKHFPLLATSSVLAALSLGAAPPTLGYIAKEKLYEAALKDLGGAGLALAVLGGLAMVAAALLCCWAPFFRRRSVQELRPVPWPMTAAGLVLAALGLIVPFYPGPLTGWMSEAVTAMATTPYRVHLSFWPGSDIKGLTVLAASAVSFLVGFAGYALRQQGAVAVVYERCSRLMDVSERAAMVLADSVLAAVKRVTLWHQNGRARSYLRVLLCATLVATIVPLFDGLEGLSLELEVSPLEVTVAALTIAGAIGTAAFQSSLAALASLGLTGLGVALCFALFGGVDLAITQLMVEALVVVVFVLCFYRLGQTPHTDTLAVRLGDGGIALGVGIVMALLVFATASGAPPAEVSQAIADASVPKAHGRNVVNVILVEVRGFDTLGEITVLGTAGVGVLALLQGRRRRS